MRNLTESVNSAAGRRYGGLVKSREWFGQLHEILAKNLDVSLKLVGFCFHALQTGFLQSFFDPDPSKNYRYLTTSTIANTSEVGGSGGKPS